MRTIQRRRAKSSSESDSNFLHCFVTILDLPSLSIGGVSNEFSVTVSSPLPCAHAGREQSSTLVTSLLYLNYATRLEIVIRAHVRVTQRVVKNSSEVRSGNKKQ